MGGRARPARRRARARLHPGYPNPKHQGGYSHDAGTCPIHEWLVPDDYHACDIAGDVPADAILTAARS